MLVLMLAIVGGSIAAKCPDLESIISDHVKTSFEPSQLAGIWYEQAIIDETQTGSSCQKLNSTVDASNGHVVMNLNSLYMGRRLIITEEFAPNSTVKGLYRKNWKIPVSGWVTVPTVVLDVTADTLILYSCKPAPVGIFQEMVFASREKQLGTVEFDGLKTVARKQGLDFTDKQLTLVSQDHCPLRW